MEMAIFARAAESGRGRGHGTGGKEVDKLECARSAANLSQANLCARLVVHFIWIASGVGYVSLLLNVCHRHPLTIFFFLLVGLRTNSCL